MSPSSPADNRLVFIAGTLVGLLILGYALFAAYPYLRGPSLTVTSPTHNSNTEGETVSITGETTRVSYLSVNDYPVPLAEDGSFHIERAFPPGYTVLVVKAEDRFGREQSDTITFIHTHTPPTYVPKTKEVEPEVGE